MSIKGKITHIGPPLERKIRVQKTTTEGFEHLLSADKLHILRFSAYVKSERLCVYKLRHIKILFCFYFVPVILFSSKLLFFRCIIVKFSTLTSNLHQIENINTEFKFSLILAELGLERIDLVHHNCKVFIRA